MKNSELKTLVGLLVGMLLIAVVGCTTAYLVNGRAAFEAPKPISKDTR